MRVTGRQAIAERGRCPLTPEDIDQLDREMDRFPAERSPHDRRHGNKQRNPMSLTAVKGPYWDGRRRLRFIPRLQKFGPRPGHHGADFLTH
jgi:hypothetical protein